MNDRPLDLIARLLMECRTESFYRYFRSRQIEVETLNRLSVGFCPKSDVLQEFRWLRDPLIEAGFLDATGSPMRLMQDRFSFPCYRDRDVVFFLFRRNPEYIPAPEEGQGFRYTQLLPKDHLSYYPHLLPGSAPYPIINQDEPEFTFVEGPIDAMRCYQAGLPNPIALHTEDAVRLLFDVQDGLYSRGRRAKKVHLLFDWDRSGTEKTIRLCQYALRTKLVGGRRKPIVEVPILIYPPPTPEHEGLDPGEMTETQVQEIFQLGGLPPGEYLRSMMGGSLDLSDPWQANALHHWMERVLA